MRKYNLVMHGEDLEVNVSRNMPLLWLTRSPVSPQIPPTNVINQPKNNHPTAA